MYLTGGLRWQGSSFLLHGTLEQLFKFLSNSEFQMIRGGAGKFLPVKCGSQSDHVSGYKQTITKVLADVVNLSLDGIARDGTTCPSLGHHGTQPNVGHTKKGLLL